MRQLLHRRLADRAMETMAVAAVGVATVVATTMAEVIAVLLFWVRVARWGNNYGTNSMYSKRLHLPGKFPWRRMIDFQAKFLHVLVGGYSQKRPYAASSYPPVWTSALSIAKWSSGWWCLPRPSSQELHMAPMAMVGHEELPCWSCLVWENTVDLSNLNHQSQVQEKQR